MKFASSPGEPNPQGERDPRNSRPNAWNSKQPNHLSLPWNQPISPAEVNQFLVKQYLLI